MIQEHRLSAYLAYDSITHLDIMAWDVPSKQLLDISFKNPPTSIDASRLGLDDEDVELIFQSYLVRNLYWLSLAGNHRITQAALPTICAAVRTRNLPLAWLDLRGTGGDATPYLDPEFSTCPVWRMPMITRRLAEKYGAQSWMTLGYPIEEENEVLISSDNYPPNRLNYGPTP